MVDWRVDSKSGDFFDGVVKNPRRGFQESENVIKWGTFHTKKLRTRLICETKSMVIENQAILIRGIETSIIFTSFWNGPFIITNDFPHNCVWS
jgi:hypothetical protein